MLKLGAVERRRKGADATQRNATTQGGYRYYFDGGSAARMRFEICHFPLMSRPPCFSCGPLRLVCLLRLYRLLVRLVDDVRAILARLVI